MTPYEAHLTVKHQGFGYTFSHDDMVIQVASQKDSGWKKTMLASFTGTFRILWDTVISEKEKNEAGHDSIIALAVTTYFFKCMSDTKSINLSNPDGNPHKDEVKDKVIKEYLPKFKDEIIANKGFKEYKKICTAWGLEVDESEEPENADRTSLMEALKTVIEKLSDAIKNDDEKDEDSEDHEDDKDDRKCNCLRCKLEGKSESEDLEPIRSIALDGIEIGLNEVWAFPDGEQMGIISPFQELARILSSERFKETVKGAIEKDEVFPFFMSTLEAMREALKESYEANAEKFQFHITTPDKSKNRNLKEAELILSHLNSKEGQEMLEAVIGLDEKARKSVIRDWECFVASLRPAN